MCPGPGCVRVLSNGGPLCGVCRLREAVAEARAQKAPSLFFKGDPRPRLFRDWLSALAGEPISEEAQRALYERRRNGFGQASLEALVDRVRARVEARDIIDSVRLRLDMPDNKEVKEVIKEVRARGYKVVSGGKHSRVLDKKGRVVVDDNGPVLISSTPGDANWRDMCEQRLRRAGVLPPKKKSSDPEDRKKTREEVEHEKKVARVEGRKDESRARHEATMKVRSRLEPLVARMGGWNDSRHGAITSGVRLVELGEIAELWGHRRQHPGSFPTARAASDSARVLKQGGTLNEEKVSFWAALLADWESAEDQRRWYYDHTREVRGLPPDWKVAMNISSTGVRLPSEVAPVSASPGNGARGPEEPEAAPVAQPGVTGTGAAQHAEPVPVSSPSDVAMRALYLMSRGDDGSDREEIMEIVQLIMACAGKESTE